MQMKTDFEIKKHDQSDLEVGALERTFGREDSPVLVRLTPDPVGLGITLKGLDAAFDFIEKLGEKNTPHVFTNRSVKLLMDGAMFSQLMQMAPHRRYGGPFQARTFICLEDEP